MKTPHSPNMKQKSLALLARTALTWPRFARVKVL